MDCETAREFLSSHGIAYENRDVSDPAVAEEMVRSHGRMATPLLVVGDQKFWGFSQNREAIRALLGVG